VPRPERETDQIRRMGSMHRLYQRGECVLSGFWVNYLQDGGLS